MDFLGNLCVCEGRAIPSTQSEFSQCANKLYVTLKYYDLFYNMEDAILKKLVYPHSKVCEQITA